MLAPSPGDGLGERDDGRPDRTDSAPAAQLPNASEGDRLPAAADAGERAPAQPDVPSTSSVVEGKSIEEQIAARMAAIGPVPPVPASEMRTDLLGWGATRQEAQDRFETVPAVDPTFKLPFREARRPARLRAGFDDPGTPPASTAEPASASNEHADTDQAVQSSSLQATRLEPAEAAWAGVPLEPADGGQRQPEGSRWASSIEDADRRSRRRASRRERAGAARLGSDGNATFDVPALSQPQEWIEPRPAGTFAERVQRGEADGAPVDTTIGADAWTAPALNEEPARPLHDGLAPIGDQSYLFDERLEQLEFLPDVPRCCRTCREYRPSDSGERGWCTSAWAFQHRRMVGADELPCGGAIGIWWLPRDDVWLDDLDVDHGRPTPLVDAMLARHYGAGGPPTPRLRRRGR